ncbi:MAG: redoxin domain-containing protein [Opitutales bacterium]|nr:redoxin domain-containing protein [Opitutales bacterium]
MKIFLSLIASIAIWSASATAATLVNGQTPPDFTLQSAKGENVSLDQYQGQVIVIEWFNHNCPFVHKFYEPGKMQQWQAEAISRGAVWLTIDSTNPAHQDHLTREQAAAVFEERHMVSTQLLLDPEGKVGKAYGAITTPHIFIIGKDGKLLYQGAVDNIRSSNSDDIALADNYLLKALDAALKGTRPEADNTRPYGCSVKYAQ